MAAINLVSLTDLKEYRALGNIPEKRAYTFIQEAQENDLRPILGDPLYKDFMDNLTQTKYIELLNGKAYTVSGYTIDFPGVKPMLCYFALARIVANNQVNITSYGVVQKSVEQSEQVEPAMVKMQVTELRSVAISYQNRLIEFLRESQTTYPLYNAVGSKGNNISGLNIFAG